MLDLIIRFGICWFRVLHWQIGPDWLRSQVRQPGFRCRYRVLDSDYATDFKDIQIQVVEGRFYFSASDVAQGARIQVEITAGGQIFSSEFESVDDVNLSIRLLDTPLPQVPSLRSSPNSQGRGRMIMGGIEVWRTC